MIMMADLCDLVEQDGQPNDLKIERGMIYAEMVSQMHSLWKQGQLCDVELLVQGRAFPAHRVVLASISPFFRAMFCSQMNESQQPCVSLTMLTSAALAMVLDFAYTGAIDLTENTVQDALHAASVLQISSLEVLCTRFLSQHLHPSNCLGVRELAHSLGCHQLYLAADRFCQDYFCEVSQYEEFLQLTADQVIDLVARDALKVTKEEDVYTAVMGWLEHSPEERTDAMVKIMEKVRLPLVQWSFLINRVSKHRLFTNNEQCRQYLQQARAFQASKYHPDLNNFAFNEAVLLAQPRIGYGATDFLYLIGGETRNRELVAEVEGYSPITNETRQFSTMPTPRRSLGVVFMGNMIFTIGGFDGTNVMRTVEVYDIEKDVWRNGASLCEPRTSVSAAALGMKIFAVGGHDGERALMSVEVYEPDINCWTRTTSLGTPRSMGAAVSVKGQLYILGGYNGVTDLKSAEMLDTRIDHWEPIASMNECRSMCDADVLDGRIIVVGGSSGSRCLSNAEMYDCDTKQWTLLASMTSPRRGLGVAVIRDVLYAAGGHDGKDYLNSVEKYDQLNQVWSAVGHLNTCRGRFGFT